MKSSQFPLIQAAEFHNIILNIKFHTSGNVLQTYQKSTIYISIVIHCSVQFFSRYILISSFFLRDFNLFKVQLYINQ